MSFLNHYKTLDTSDLAMIASKKGYDVYEDEDDEEDEEEDDDGDDDNEDGKDDESEREVKYSREQLIEMISDTDKKAEELATHYAKLSGDSLALCHGRADVRILQLDYNRTLFIDKDPSVLGDIIDDIHNVSFGNQMFDNILSIHGYADVDKLFPKLIVHLNQRGYLFITRLGDSNDRITTLEHLGMKYLGNFVTEVYRVPGIRIYTFLTFQKT